MSNMGRTGQVPCWPCCDRPMLLVSEVLDSILTKFNMSKESLLKIRVHPSNVQLNKN